MEKKNCYSATSLKSIKIVKSLYETLIDAKKGQGGSYDVTNAINIKEKKIDKELFINTTIDTKIVGIDNKTKKEAFKINCTIIGIFSIEKDYKKYINNDILPIILARQIYPFIRGHITDLLSKSGYKNVEIPWEIAYKLADDTKKKIAKKIITKKKTAMKKIIKKKITKKKTA